MNRNVTRRSVVKLAYAAPVVVATVRLGVSPVAAISPGCVPTTGHVYDAATGAPITRVYLDLPGAEVWTDATGFYDAGCLSNGGFEVIRTGYVRQSGRSGLMNVAIKDWYLVPI